MTNKPEPFIQSFSEELRLNCSDLPAIEAVLTRLLAQARAAWPKIEIQEDRFVQFLAERIPSGAEPLAVLEKLPASDLLVAWGCTQGLSPALEAFGRLTAPVMNQLVRRARMFGIDSEEFRQELGVRLFVKDSSKRGFISTYSGRGPLGAWFRVIAARFLADEIERQAPAANRWTNSEMWVEQVGDIDIEKSVLRGELRGPFQQAVNEAAEKLTSQERMLLQQYYTHHVGIDGLAKILGVHRSNASRAIVRARAQFLSVVKQRLGQQLKLGSKDLDSIVRLFRSDLTISLGGILKE